jgi:hypothetical protein
MPPERLYAALASGTRTDPRSREQFRVSCRRQRARFWLFPGQISCEVRAVNRDGSADQRRLVDTAGVSASAVTPPAA